MLFSLHLHLKRSAAPLRFPTISEFVHDLSRRLPVVQFHQYFSETKVKEISEYLESCRLNPKEIGEYVDLRSNYVRRLIGGESGKFVCLLLCWDKKQGTPIHDHAAASCWVKVLKGTLEETIYSEDHQVQEVRKLPAQGVSFMTDKLGIHRIRNISACDYALSLHLYAPPFASCFKWDLGGAKTWVPMNSLYSPTSVPVWQSGQLGISDLIGALGEPPQIPRVLGEFGLSSQEWDKYCSPLNFNSMQVSRSLVFLDQHYSIIVSCWAPGQASLRHNHGDSKSWVKVLLGQLKFQYFGEDDQVQEEITLTSENGCCQPQDQRDHCMVNPDGAGCAVSIHVYSPPFKQMVTQNGEVFPIVHQNVETQDVFVPHLHGKTFCSLRHLQNFVESLSPEDSHVQISNRIANVILHDQELQNRKCGVLVDNQWFQLVLENPQPVEPRGQWHWVYETDPSPETPECAPSLGVFRSLEAAEDLSYLSLHLVRKTA